MTLRVLLRGCGGRVAESDAALRDLIEKYGKVPTYLIAEAQACSGKERGIRGSSRVVRSGEDERQEPRTLADSNGHVRSLKG